MVALRSYQDEAANGVEEKLAEFRSTLIVMATGTGKTTVFAEVARRWIAAGRGRVLVLAHREELITQAARRIAEQTGLSVGIEMAQSRADRMFVPDVVVGTVQTLCRDARLAENPRDAFGLVIIDEAHHATADTYARIVDYFDAAKVLGVTATPDRGDGTAMREAFESVAYVYEIRDAIEQGHLCRIKQKAVKLHGLDLSAVRTTAGDLNEGDTNNAMMVDEVLAGTVRGILDESGSRPTMIFGVTVAHAYALAEMLNTARPGSARALDGKSDRELRKATLRDFSAGRFQYLCNCALFTEGFDEPTIACVAVARPTKSRALYVQMVGRGTRIKPAGSDLLILDFVGNAGRHSLVNALDILDGNQDAAAKALAEKKIKADPNLDIMEALDAASHEIAEAKKRQVLERSRYSTQEIDPFAMVATFLDIAPRPGRWGGAPPDPEDLVYLADRAKGLDVRGLDGGQVSEIARAVRNRYDRGLSSWNQARVLIRNGLDPEVDARTAAAAMNVLAGNRWKPTDALRRAFSAIEAVKAYEKQPGALAAEVRRLVAEREEALAEIGAGRGTRRAAGGR